MSQTLNTNKVGDSGTRDVRVDRVEEGLPGVATVDNPTANPPTRASFDAGLAVMDKVKAAAQIDTQWEYNGLDQGASVKRAAPGAW